MSDIISEYQNWKQQGKDLRMKAKQAMEARFGELLTEAVRVAEDYREDFGVPLKPPSVVTAFRYKSGVKPKIKKAAKTATAPKSAAIPPKADVATAAKKADPKVAGLQRRLDTARKKLEAAKAAGTPTRDLEDKIYEIEDQITVAIQD